MATIAAFDSMDDAIAFLEAGAQRERVERKRADARAAAQPKSSTHVAPRPGEAPQAGDPQMPAPECPQCHCVDPRAFIDESVIEVARAHLAAGATDPPELPLLADVECCIARFHGGQVFASSEMEVQCYLCNAKFNFSPHGNLFNGPVNCKSVSVPYVARLLQTRPYRRRRNKRCNRESSESSE